MPIKQEGELRLKSAMISVGASAELVLLRNFVLQEAFLYPCRTLDDVQYIPQLDSRHSGTASLYQANAAAVGVGSVYL